MCIIAHACLCGDRGSTSTSSKLRKKFSWLTLSTDVRTFVCSCIQCLWTTKGERVTSPFGSAVYGRSPNALLQFDYTEVAPSASDDKYVLMLRDDRSEYCWFFLFSNTSAENVARAIIDWAAAFVVQKSLMPDVPTNFKNETVCLVAKGLKGPHHFTLPYSPWSNGPPSVWTMSSFASSGRSRPSFRSVRTNVPTSYRLYKVHSSIRLRRSAAIYPPSLPSPA